MLISELSRRSGVPVATIKYYLREGLLAKGESTSATRAEYTDAHLKRLGLVRALVGVAELPLSGVRTVLDALDNPDFDLHRLLGAVQYALTPEAPSEDGAASQEAERAVGELLSRHGWRVWPDSPARRRLALTLATLDRLGHPIDEDFLDAYAAAARTAADRLLGRGPGLTPSGDDVLSGLLVTLHQLGGGRLAGPEPVDFAEALGAHVTRRADSATTAVSATLLAHAARGEAPAEVVDVLDALGGTIPMAEPLTRLLAIGHSSGPALARGIGVGGEVLLRHCAPEGPRRLSGESGPARPDGKEQT